MAAALVDGIGCWCSVVMVIGRRGDDRDGAVGRGSGIGCCGVMGCSRGVGFVGVGVGDGGDDGSVGEGVGVVDSVGVGVGDDDDDLDVGEGVGVVDSAGVGVGHDDDHLGVGEGVGVVDVDGGRDEVVDDCVGGL